MPRFLLTLLMLIALAMLPACGGGDDSGKDSSDDKDADTDDGNDSSDDKYAETDLGMDSDPYAGIEHSVDSTAQTATREETIEAMFSLVDSLPEILVGVYDDATADIAAGQMKEIARSLKPLGETWADFGEMTIEETESINTKYGERYKKLDNLLLIQMYRLKIEHPQLRTKLKDEMQPIADIVVRFDIKNY